MEWISIEEDLPYPGDIVIVCDKFNSFVSLGRYIDNEDDYHFDLMYIDEVQIDSEITHWMSLPSLPKESYGMD